MTLIESPMLPSMPQTKKELLNRVPDLYGNTYEILPRCKGGAGAPGCMTELLLGSEGKNHAFADTVGIEVKYHGSQPTLLTLFHLDVNPNGGPTANSALIPLLKEYGYLRDGKITFRHTVSERSRKFEVDIIKVDSNQKLILRSLNDYEVYWDENDLLNAASKLRNTILISGSATKDKQGKKYVTLHSAIYLTKFKPNQFLNLVSNRVVKIDLDFRENKAGSLLTPNTVLRNHGTKFRIRMKDVGLLWGEIEPIS